MNIVDIIALAKAGYKKSDIQELLALDTDNAKSSAEKPAETQTEGVPEVTEEQNVTVQPVENKEPKPDYKLLYEQSQNELKKAQSNNIKRDISSQATQPNEWDTLNDITSSFM